MSDDDTKQEDEKSDLEKQEEAAVQEVAALEDDPPKNLEDWPDGDAKYKTFGGPDGNTGYDDGPTKNLGESNVRHLEDGSITVNGEKVDNPEDYKGDPIPGGPTDPDAQRLAGDKVAPKGEEDDEGSDESGPDGESSESSEDSESAEKSEDSEDSNND